jgi:hypothetical protein
MGGRLLKRQLDYLTAWESSAAVLFPMRVEISQRARGILPVYPWLLPSMPQSSRLLRSHRLHCWQQRPRDRGSLDAHVLRSARNSTDDGSESGMKTGLAVGRWMGEGGRPFGMVGITSVRPWFGTLVQRRDWPARCSFVDSYIEL